MEKTEKYYGRKMESSQEKLKRCQNNSAMNSRKTLLSKKKWSGKNG